MDGQHLKVTDGWTDASKSLHLKCSIVIFQTTLSSSSSKDRDVSVLNQTTDLKFTSKLLERLNRF